MIGKCVRMVVVMSIREGDNREDGEGCDSRNGECVRQRRSSYAQRQPLIDAHSDDDVSA